MAIASAVYLVYYHNGRFRSLHFKEDEARREARLSQPHGTVRAYVGMTNDADYTIAVVTAREALLRSCLADRPVQSAIDSRVKKYRKAVIDR